MMRLSNILIQENIKDLISYKNTKGKEESNLQKTKIGSGTLTD